MEFKIRPYHPSDCCALNRICIQTANYGEDPSDQYADPEVIAHMYSGPYAVYEPDLCFILTGDGVPMGYILGTRDSEAFSRRTAAEWFPVLRERYPLPAEDDRSENAGAIRALHRGYHPGPGAEEYPAHLHIDLLASARHGGNGSKLMEVFLTRLRELHVPSVHLGVGGGNTNAIAFYERMGFKRVKEYEWGIIFGMKLV
ncbi:MAG: GNAT family N-acetyltransferase [Anaerolineaceae bacterium]|nr:GNAT family N-acetyltransferase [Anaerolineaceae bacterium]